MILNAIVVLGIIGLLAAVILYLAASRFKVDEDPRIAEIESLLPGANCGGCGKTGCHAFAVAVRNATSLEGLNCSVAGAAGMELIAKAVGLDPARGARKVAVVKCSADCDTRSIEAIYDGIRDCRIENSLFQGETRCVYGCLGGGNCVNACGFGALTIPEGETLPRVDIERCTACGQCVAACPRGVITLKELPEHPVSIVNCNNRNRGPQAMKDCPVSCIGCSRCARECSSEAITITSFLADIDTSRCTGCGKCEQVCPRKSITTLRPEL